ncbi:MAG: prepilin-type N-terminal cleavage/methylation domain-containing protein [Patescibacteria group bacterium]|jgi:type IV fimbrial biogenesis protein FimT
MPVNHRGVTLLELVVAMAIIFLIVTISFPSLKSYSSYQDLKNSTEKMIGDLKLAQQKSVTEQIKYSLQVTALSADYSMIKKSQSPVTVENYILPTPIVVASTTGIVAQEVIFNSAGAVENSGEIFLQNLQTLQQTKIIIKPSGYVSWEKI